MFEYQMEHIMSYNVTLAPPEVIGPVPEGIRVNFYFTGGAVTGPRVLGKVRPVGADWLILRRDGVAVLDIRATVETNDGALLYLTYPGIIDLGETGYDDFLKGTLPPSGTKIHITPRVHTSHPNYLWLNRLHCVGIGRLYPDRMEVAYDVYAVR